MPYASPLDTKTLQAVQRLAADHGGDLIVRLPDTDYQRYDATLTAYPFYDHDHHAYHPISCRCYTCWRRHRHHDPWGYHHDGRGYVVTPFTYVTHSWDVWRLKR